jgi:hypothetical protein
VESVSISPIGKPFQTRMGSSQLPHRRRRSQFFCLMFVASSVGGHGESLWHACS